MKLSSIVLSAGFLCCGLVYGGVRNGGFEAVQTVKPDSGRVKGAIAKGWRFAAPIVLPRGWRPSGQYTGSMEVVRVMAHTGRYCVKLGGNGHFISTFGKVEKGGVYKCSLWARGKGSLVLGFYQYGEMPGEPAKFIPAAKARGNIPIKTGPLKDGWTLYTGLYRPAPIVSSINLFLAAKGECYVDDVRIEKANILDAEVFDEMARMKKADRYLLADSQVNITKFMKRLEEAKKSLAELKPILEDSSLKKQAELVKLMNEKITFLLDRENISRYDYNTATALRGIAKRLVDELSFKDVSE